MRLDANRLRAPQQQLAPTRPPRSPLSSSAAAATPLWQREHQLDVADDARREAEDGER